MSENAKKLCLNSFVQTWRDFSSIFIIVIMKFLAAHKLPALESITSQLPEKLHLTDKRFKEDSITESFSAKYSVTAKWSLTVANTWAKNLDELVTRQFKNELKILESLWNFFFPKNHISHETPSVEHPATRSTQSTLTRKEIYLLSARRCAEIKSNIKGAVIDN